MHKVKALVNHNPEKYLGSTASSLKLKTNEQGLDFEITVPQTSLGNDMVALAQAEGALPVSVGFVGLGRKSNIFKKPIEATRAAVVDEPAPPKELELELPLPKVQPADQLLDGSDYTEGVDPRTKIRWRVYHTLDLREISLLQGLDPAWQGVTAKIGDSAVQRAKAQLDYLQRRTRCFY